jgi:hypothetical protein
VGRLSRERAAPFREAGDLCAVEAIDREGLLVTSEGALLRFLRAAPKNPLVMSGAERELVGRAFGQLAGRLQAGQSIQFYVEAAPVRLDALLERSEVEAERAWHALAGADDRASALRRLHAALRESLERHADEQAAVDVAYYVVVPYLPDQSNQLDWRNLLSGRRRRLASAPLERSLASHRRVTRESLHLTDSVRGDLEALDLSTHLLSGPEVLDLVWRRFNPTTADRTPERRPGAREDRLEVVGELDAITDARDAARAAHALREMVAASGIDWPDHRRLFGVNRGAELRGRTPDYEMLAQEEELGELLKELSGHERSAAFEVSIYSRSASVGRNPIPSSSPRRSSRPRGRSSRPLTPA